MDTTTEWEEPNELPKKLNIIQKWQIKSFLKQSRQKLEKLKNHINQEAEYRKKLEIATTELQELLQENITIQAWNDYEDKDLPNKEIKQDTELNKENIKYLTTKQLEEVYNIYITAIEKEK